MSTHKKPSPGEKAEKYDDCAENGNDTTRNDAFNGSRTGAERDKNREDSEQGPYRTQDENNSGNQSYETQDPAPHNETDSGQGAPGIQGQYPGNNDQDLYPKPGTAPDRPDKDAMNRTGSSHVALGSRDVDSDKRRSK